MSKPVAQRLEDGSLVDLSRADGQGEVVASSTPEGREVIRHSTAHVMAQAVLALWPDAKYAIGPPIQDPPGFYYDFDIGRPFTPEDLEAIEAEMERIIAEAQEFERDEITLDEAREVFTNQPYKLEIIEGIGQDSSEQGVLGDKVSVYRNRDFVDLCRGPHLPSTKDIPAFKLLNPAGAYWRGDSERPMLQRIYGTAWESPKALKAYLQQREEAERRDHRKLGRELDLFSSPDELGAGLFLWHPNGAIIRNELVKHAEGLHPDYQPVITPHMAKGGLWETSGHLAKFAENMYPPMSLDEGGDYYVKPMNCPFHVFIYGSQTRSYRDLPFRLYEMGTVYRMELSGTLHGMLRIRGLTQDDSHIFCTEDQLVDELMGVMDLLDRLYEPFGFSEPEIHLSTNPGEAIGTPEMWEKATEALRNALDQAGKSYEVAEGEGAFYGPKIDFHFRDAIGRPWQLTTIQCDFALPERFDLTYIGEDGDRHRPVMVHRALYGAIERFFAVLTEHYAGAFPTWLAPTQVQVLPITDRNETYASKLADSLESSGIRVSVMGADDTLGNRIRKATMSKVPYMLIVGPKEEESQTLSVRKRSGDESKGVSLDEFRTQITQEIAAKSH